MGFFIIGLIRLALDICSLILLVSAIMSWFPTSSPSKFEEIVHTASEYLCAPMRGLCAALNIGGRSMFDIPFLLTVIIIAVLQAIFR